jgi:hypothetical protein
VLTKADLCTVNESGAPVAVRFRFKFQISNTDTWTIHTHIYIHILQYISNRHAQKGLQDRSIGVLTKADLCTVNESGAPVAVR